MNKQFNLKKLKIHSPILCYEAFWTLTYLNYLLIRDHLHITLSPKGRGFSNDYANVIFALYIIDYTMPNLITEGGGGLKTDKKWLRYMWTAPY